LPLVGTSVLVPILVNRSRPNNCYKQQYDLVVVLFVVVIVVVAEMNVVVVVVIVVVVVVDLSDEANERWKEFTGPRERYCSRYPGNQI